jgi:hypothetical protein
MGRVCTRLQGLEQRIKKGRLKAPEKVGAAEPHSFDGGQIGLFGLDHIFAFIGLLSGKVDRMFEEAEDAVLI